MFHVGLDVSVTRTAMCIIDAASQVVRKQSMESTPEAIATAVAAFGSEVERVGLEAVINSTQIARRPGEAKLPVIARPIIHPHTRAHHHRTD